jgi:hypothetical protein
VLRDAAGNRVVLLTRATDFFHDETYLWDGGQAKRLPLPEKLAIRGLIDGNLVFKIEEPGRSNIRAPNRTFPAGALMEASPRLDRPIATPAQGPNSSSPTTAIPASCSRRVRASRSTRWR